MISEMLQTSRWYYVKEPALPDVPRGRNSWYRKRALYTEIIEAVKGSPGVSTGEVARKLGRPYDYVSPLLFHLKKFGSLRYEPVGVERTDGLAALQPLEEFFHDCLVIPLSPYRRVFLFNLRNGFYNIFLVEDYESFGR